MGGTLGLIGGGGSILTVPIFVYLFGLGATEATAYSLFVVGLTALTGAFACMRKNLVDYRAVVLFGLPSMLAVFVTRRWVMPAIPDTVFCSGEIVLSKGTLIMLVFSCVMLMASLAMIFSKRKKGDKSEDVKTSNKTLPLIVLDGVFVGTLTGFVGAGGGFLIVPALIWALHLDMRVAVGTSLSVIAVKSLVGFSGDLSHFNVDWGFLLTFSFIAVCGILVGGALSRRVSHGQLKRLFGWFVLLAGVAIVTRELMNMG